MAKASNSVLITILRNAQALGIDVEKLKSRVNLPLSVTNDPDTRVDSEIGFALMREAEILSNDPLFGLHHGVLFQASDMGLVGYLVLNAPNTWQALESFCKYQHIYGEGLLLSAELKQGKIEIGFSVHPDVRCEVPDCAYISHMAGFMSTVKWLMGKSIQPLHTGLVIDKPGTLAQAQEYQTIFGANIAYHQSRSMLVFEEQDFTQNILTGNHALYEMFEHRAQAVLKDLGQDNEFQRLVARELYRTLDKEKPSLDSVSKVLCKSPRTVQRLLKDEGTSFQSVLDQVREKLAKYYLNTRNLNIDEIAYLLGFSESSAFRKAFKKWTRLSPEAYRAEAV
ncbi:MAG: AraC family transcriptional regulator [Gammaproteobacteria bacterium]|nr:AraC family transcriptional regulator [Gammaproteobacteria bacterium]